MPRLRRALVFVPIAILVSAAVLESHDLFLRPRDFVVKPNASVSVRVLNGTFTTSEGSVTADRLRDLSVAAPAGVEHPADSGWTSAAKESEWRVRVGGPGTYVLGASLHPRTIRLTGAEFNGYLREEGLGDVVGERRRAGIADNAAHERYAKHVKALVRVTGSVPAAADTAYRQVLGYPAELVPVEDPYRLRPGATLRVRALVDGAPVAGQAVLAGGRTVGGAAIPERTVRTDANGIARIPLRTRGVWYVKFIRMRPVTGDTVNYESKWATLTFARP